MHPLIDLINTNKIETIAEVGVLAGGTTNALLSACETITDIYMVDPWRPYKTIDQENSSDKRCLAYTEEQFNGYLGRCEEIEAKDRRAHICRGRSTEVARIFRELGFRVDMVIIDADHTYKPVVRDILEWLPVLNVGNGTTRKFGIMSGHDYSSGWDGVVRAVNDVFDKNITRLNSGYWYKCITEENKSKYYERARHYAK